MLWVRVGFMAAAVVGGFGVMFYAGLWMVLPAQQHFEDHAPGLAAAERQGKRRPGRIRRLADFGPLIAIGAIALGVAGFFALATGQGGFFWALVLLVAGVALLWRQADEAQRERWLDSSARINVVRAVVGVGGLASYLRLLLGGVLVVGRDHRVLLGQRRLGGRAQRGHRGDPVLRRASASSSARGCSGCRRT